MVRTSTYQQVPTPQGLRGIERGEVEFFSTEMYGNLNTGVMEQYLEEKTQREGFQTSKWPWRIVIIGIVIGALFTVIIEFVGLKVGLVISGTWYLMFVVGVAFKWNASEVNISASAATAASHMSTGFVFTFPAMYLLAFHPNYAGPDGQPLIHNLPPLAVPLVAASLAGLLGTMYFIIFRRIWLVDDPLPVPSFESNVKLLDIAEHVSRRAADTARRSIRGVVLWTSLTFGFVIVRDWPVEFIGSGREQEHFSLMDQPFKEGIVNDPLNSWWGREGIIQTPLSWPTTWISFQIEPILISLGWFMRSKVAFIFSAGSLLTWFVVVPLAVHLGVPVYVTGEGFRTLISLPAPSYSAYTAIARPMGIGCILGGGVTGLVRMYPAFKRVGADVRKAMESAQGKGGGGAGFDYIPGKGWYDWPVIHIPILMAVTFVGVILVFVLGGYPVPHSIAFGLVLVLTAFAIGAIAVKVMGEIGTEPVSGTSFIVLLMLIGVFWVLDLATEGALNTERTAVMAVIGTTTFAGAITMSGNVVTDFKAAIYVGNRPYHMMNSVLWAVIPGAIPSAIGAAFLSEGLAKGTLQLTAPQANAFATLLQVIFGGQSNDLLVTYLAFGFFIGVLIDVLSGMGTAFGLGMYFPLFLTLPALAAGVGRDLWQARYVEQRAVDLGWDETTKTLKLVDSFIMATGWLIGASIAGTIVAMYLVIHG